MESWRETVLIIIIIIIITCIADSTKRLDGGLVTVWCEQVARRGSTQYGMPVPTLVHFEQQIDAELLQPDDGATAAAAASRDCRGVADGQEDSTQPEMTSTSSNARRKPAVDVDWMSLDEMVSCISLHL